MQIKSKPNEAFLKFLEKYMNKVRHDKHDVPNFSSDLLVVNQQTPLMFSSYYIFNSHYMFRRSGLGHMLLHIDRDDKDGKEWVWRTPLFSMLNKFEYFSHLLLLLGGDLWIFLKEDLCSGKLDSV